MTPAEQRQLRDGLETAVRGMLMEFENKSELVIRDIHFERTHELNGKSTIMQVYIDANIGRLRLV